MEYTSCDKCGTEFTTENSSALTLRCPDCNQWVDLDPTPVYSSRYVDKGYVDEYVDFDMDNYGYDD